MNTQDLKIIEKYIPGKTKIGELAKELRLTYDVVIGALKRNGISTKNPRKKQIPDSKILVEMYESGMTVQEIHLKVDCPVAAIAKSLKASGIKLARVSESDKIQAMNLYLAGNGSVTKRDICVQFGLAETTFSRYLEKNQVDTFDVPGVGNTNNTPHNKGASDDKKHVELTQDMLKSRMRYSPNTGEFFWLNSGKLAGTINSSGGISIYLDNRPYQATKLAMLYMNNDMPSKKYVYHIDGDKVNNIFSNLSYISPKKSICKKIERGISYNTDTGQYYLTESGQSFDSLEECQEVKYGKSNKKFSVEHRKNIAKSNKGRIPWNKGRTGDVNSNSLYPSVRVDEGFVRAIFDYCDSGNLIRKSDGIKVGTVNNNRYSCSINGRSELIHRLVYMYHFDDIGQRGKFDIDHIDGNPRNNKIENLRVVTKNQNAMNRKVQTRKCDEVGAEFDYKYIQGISKLRPLSRTPNISRYSAEIRCNKGNAGQIREFKRTNNLEDAMVYRFDWEIKWNIFTKHDFEIIERRLGKDSKYLTIFKQ